MRLRNAFQTFALGVGAAIASVAPALAQETAPDTATTAELEAIYEARMDSARMRFTEADVRFMSGMIHHHAQALVMAGFAPTHGASPTIQTLAARIINAQKDEIAWMERWLEDRGQPVPETGAGENALGGDGHAMHGAGHEMHGNMNGDDHAAPEEQADHAPDSTHAIHMPGMLTPEQMQELDEARGPEFDRLFLTYMIQHHQGAVTMVDELFGTDGAAQDPATFKLASDVQADQRTEIARMERMLSALPAVGGAR
ncbi:MAG: DUF305 domain-containing protein [Vicinamibacteria bacterium]